MTTVDLQNNVLCSSFINRPKFIVMFHKNHQINCVGYFQLGLVRVKLKKLVFFAFTVTNTLKNLKKTNKRLSSPCTRIDNFQLNTDETDHYHIIDGNHR